MPTKPTTIKEEYSKTQILATLNHTCGPGKFHFTASENPFPRGFFV